MTKLKLGPLPNDKPVKMSVEIPATVHRQLIAYAEVLGRETGEVTINPSKLIVPMIERFMATDRAFLKARRHLAAQSLLGSAGAESAADAAPKTTQVSGSRSDDANRP
ncbi:hypothetical protein ABIF68_005580 [Bradyrhizobium japonicum]|jgi:hypothetical protein|nr:MULTISPECIES: DUF2274 domain-containing protein [Bradyrhizobium]MBR0945521.1 DUF2274 domain-containing protein [Bradyrhizobium liaoningense]MDI2074458.1 DUF2274 domain-containing protein [Bradyrhizobium sp. Mp27]